MDLRIDHIRNRGKPNEELVVLFAETGCDLGYYALCDTTFLPNGRISNALRHFFWFPHHSVEAGDYVMLRTGFGAEPASAWRSSPARSSGGSWTTTTSTSTGR